MQVLEPVKEKVAKKREKLKIPVEKGRQRMRE